MNVKAKKPLRPKETLFKAKLKCQAKTLGSQEGWNQLKMFKRYNFRISYTESAMGCHGFSFFLL